MNPSRSLLQNFQSYRNAEIDFSKIKAACIQGPNGAGKSAIIDGMLYALFGITSKGREDDIVMIGASDMSDTFEFEQTGKQYRVIRKKSNKGRGKTLVELYELNRDTLAWEPLATGTEANKMIIDIIGRDYNTLTSSSFLLQGQGEKIITARPSDRHRVIFDILGLERYGEYRKNTTTKKNILSGTTKTLTENISELKEQAGKLAEMTVLKENSDRGIDETKKLIKDFEKALSEFLSERAIIEDKLKGFDEMSQELSLLKEEQTTLSLKKKEIETSVTPVPNSLLQSVNAEIKKGMQHVMSRSSELKATMLRTEETAKETESLKAKTTEFKRNVQETEEHVKRYRAILSKKEMILDALKREKEEHTKLEGTKAELKTLQEEIKFLVAQSQKAAEIEASLLKLKNILTALEKEQESKIWTAQNSLLNAEKMAKLVEQTICKGQGEYARCPLIKDAVTQRESIQSIKKEISSLENPIDVPENALIRTLKEQLVTLDPEKIKRDLNEKTERGKDIKRKAESSEKILGSSEALSKQEAELTTAEREITRAEASLEAMRKELTDLDKKIALSLKNTSELGKIKEEMLIIDAAIERLSIENEVGALNNRIEAAGKALSKIQKELSAYDALKSRKALVDDEIKKKHLLAEELKEKEKGMIEKSSRFAVAVELCKSAHEKALLKEEELTLIKNKIKVFEYLEQAYEKIPFIILDNVIPIIEDEANKVLTEISTSSMRIELRSEKMNKSNKNVRDELDIIVSDIAGERPIEMYSGGEKTRLVLALTVGLADLSSRKAGVKTSTLVIDEPAGLDSQGLKDFGKCFISLVESSIFEKGLLIAHDEEIRDVFEQKILVSKEGSISKVEVIT